MILARRVFLQLLAAKPQPSVLIVASDAGWLECAGGTIAAQIAGGANAILLRVGNDEKESVGLTPEETAHRNRQESEAAAKLLGISETISFGYRSSELKDVPHTTIRDRILFLIRHHRLTALFFPNPHTEHDRNLDRYYVGAAAEDAWHCARYANFLPAATLPPHIVPEVYYYAPPTDPRRREPESTATFTPQPRQIDISKTFATKLAAARALRTINRATATRLKQTLQAEGRRLPLLDNINQQSIDKLVEENLRGLAAISAQGTAYQQAEEFRYAGIEYGIPQKYLR